MPRVGVGLEVGSSCYRVGLRLLSGGFRLGRR